MKLWAAKIRFKVKSFLSQTHLIVACRGWCVLWKKGRDEAGSTSWTGRREIWSLCPGSLCFSSPSWMPVGWKQISGVQSTSRQSSYEKHAAFRQNTDVSRSLSPGEPWPWARSGGQNRCGRLPPSLREPQAPVGWSPPAQSWLQHHKHRLWSFKDIYVIYLPERFVK